VSCRTRSLVALGLGALAVLGTLTLAYGLVYPSGAQDTKSPVSCAIVGGVFCALMAVFISLAARRRAEKDSERFVAQLALVLGAFFLCVVALGFGIPAFVLGVHD
jgi:hypothetical protein